MALIESNSTIFSLSGLFCLLFIGKTLIKRWRSYSVDFPHPPGPKPKLIIGNHNEFPTVQPWLTYTEWAKQYGDLVYIRDFHQGIIVINTLSDAIALLEKRSRNYSDRPTTTMVYMMGWDFNVAMLPYGDRWRRHRRLFQQHFKPEVAVSYQPIQTKKIHEFLKSLLSTPEDFMMHNRTVAAAVVMSAMYDYEISPRNDKFVTIAEQAVNRLAKSAFPGATAVNIFPFLRHLPTWFPGTGFKRFAAECKVYTDQMQNDPYNFVRDRLASEGHAPGVLAKVLTQKDARGGSPEYEDDIKAVVATAYAGGADTTVSSVGTMLYAMTIHPAIQKKAQEEIDRVIGSDRLPDFSDRSSLPYIEAVYREILRWKPVLPTGVPRSAVADDIYKGYFISKGTIFIPNIWAMTRDETRYGPDTGSFRPERFFDNNGDLNDDDLILAYGFGRRICPGRYMASSSLWLITATFLSTFNIAKAKDANGNEMPVDDTYSDELLTHKHPFDCSITPRSEAARQLILEATSG